VSGCYYVVLDRWQRFSSLTLSLNTFSLLSPYCCEFLIHGVDVEGKQQGVDAELLNLLSSIISQHPEPLVITYAGGVRNLQDIQLIERIGKGKIHCSIGSALDLFGGSLAFKTVVDFFHQQQQQQTTED